MRARAAAAIEATASAWGEVGLDRVSLPASRPDQLAAELLPDAVDVHVDEIRERVLAVVEEVLVEGGARDELSAMERQVFEHRVLAPGERDRRSPARHRARSCVDDHGAQPDDRMRLPGRATDERA